jgi:photosystem II stability/assembly factor-like uncharacterized protein
MKRREQRYGRYRALAGLFALIFGLGLRTSAQAQDPSFPPAVRFDWEPVGLGGGGAMFTPAISPADPNRMMVNCDMSGAYLSRDGGQTWNLIHHRQLQGNIRCRPAFHPTDPQIIFAAGDWAGSLRVSRDGGQTFHPIGDLTAGLVGEIAIDPDQPERMLVGTSSGVALSNDGGVHWTTCPGVGGTPLAFRFERTDQPGNRALFAGTTKGLFRSEDGGQTWLLKTNGLPWAEVRSFTGGSDPRTRNTVLYCSVMAKAQAGQYVGGVYRSRDRGESWESVMKGDINREIRQTDEWADGPIAQYPCVLAGDADPDTVYAFNTSTGFDPPHHNAIWKSENAGESWKATFYSDPRWKGLYNVEPNWRTAALGQNFQEVGLGWAICPSDSRRVLFTDMGMCYLTRDGGRTWLSAVSKTADPAKTGPDSRWRPRGLVVTTTWNYYVDPHASNRHYIAYTDIGFARSTDGGRSWQWWGKKGRPPWQNTCYELAFDPEIPEKIWGAFSAVHDIPNGNIIENRHTSTGPGGICLSVDSGVTWKPANLGLPVSATTSVIVDPRSPRDRRRLFAAVWNQGVYRSEDGGQHWAPVGQGLGSEKNKRVTRVFLHRDGSLFALVTALRVGRIFQEDGVGLFRLNPETQRWEPLTATRFLWPKDFTVDPADSRTLYLSVADAGPRKEGGLYRTTDAGTSWDLLARKGPEHFGAYLDPRRKGWIYMTLTEGAPEYGLYLSQDNGQTFLPVENMPFSNIQRVSFDPQDERILYVTTFGASVFRGTMNLSLR